MAGSIKYVGIVNPQLPLPSLIYKIVEYRGSLLHTRITPHGGIILKATDDKSALSEAKKINSNQ